MKTLMIAAQIATLVSTSIAITNFVLPFYHYRKQCYYSMEVMHERNAHKFSLDLASIEPVSASTING